MRSAIILIANLAALVACGQPASTAGEAAAQGGGGQAAFIQACVDRYAANNPQARQWAPDQCAQDWQKVVASADLATAILSAGAGAAPSGNRLGDLGVTVDRTSNIATWSWAETGGLIPYEAVGALEQRGAQVARTGCSQLGVGEYTTVYRVTPQSGRPFQLSIYERSAPTANAESFYNASVDMSGRAQTLAQLRADGAEWAPACQ